MTEHYYRIIQTSIDENRLFTVETSIPYHPYRITTNTIKDESKLMIRSPYFTSTSYFASEDTSYVGTQICLSEASDFMFCQYSLTEVDLTFDAIAQISTTFSAEDCYY